MQGPTAESVLQDEIFGATSALGRVLGNWDAS